jgi:hypothetical protein
MDKRDNLLLHGILFGLCTKVYVDALTYIIL